MSTSSPNAPPMPTAAVKPRRRWLRWTLLFAGALVLGLGLLIGYTLLATRNAWNEAIAEAERDLPRWRFMELEEDRPTIPDAENSALLMIAIRKKSGGFSISGNANHEKFFAKLPPPAQLNQQQVQLLRTELGKIAKPLAEARKLKDMPRGRIPVTYADDLISTLLPDHQEVRQFSDWLSNDAMLLAQDGELDRAVESCQAILNASRAMDGDVILIPYLIRLALLSIHVTTLERVLAQGEPSPECLRETQARIERETKSTGLLQALRGNRAGWNHFFEAIDKGKISGSQLRGWGVGVRPGAAKQGITIDMVGALGELYPPTLLKFYPEYLQFMNRAVEIAKRPIHERAELMKEWDKEILESRNPLVLSLAPALTKIDLADTRTQALLRAALAALAWERYRLQHGAWPASLDALVQAKLLDKAPSDPFDGQPMRYRKTKEGIVIYSIGVDLKDDQGNIDRDRTHDPGVDIGFRLWDARRQPPMPIVVLPEQN